MTFPEVQFVAAPEDGAEVLFDFNLDFPWGASGRVLHDGFTLGTPSVLGDPDGLGVQYGPRTVSFSLEIDAPRYAAIETQALLARTFMLRRRGWLRVKLDEFTSPVWLRTFTPTPGELSFERFLIQGSRDRWTIPVSVAAEPFIRGERVDLWNGQIQSNPAAASNPTQVVLPAVVGDAPAPLRIEAEFGAPRNYHDMLWATSAVPSSYTPIVWQIGTGDVWYAGSDTSAPVSNAGYSGGSFRTVDFATFPASTMRLTGYPPPIQPGRYRVFLRAARGGSGSLNVRFGYTRDGGTMYGGGSTITLDYAVDQSTMIDLGEYDLPLPRTDAHITTAAASPNVTLHAARLSGAPVLNLDAFVLVPLDLTSVTSLEAWEKCDTLVSSFGESGPLADVNETQIWDGDAEATFRRQAGVSDGSISAVNRGRFPTVRPGVSNLLTLFQQTRTSSVSPSAPVELAASADVYLSYQPRWLWLGGG